MLWPLRRAAGTAILPFQYARLPRARRVVLETCPSSVLKRLNLPYRGCKEPGAPGVHPRRRKVREAILRALAPFIAIGSAHRRLVLDDPGGDALDAVLAAAGGARAWEDAPHAAIARDPRCRREGYVYA